METISTITLAYNEQEDIERCLRSLQWADERIVIDCFSSDNTVMKVKPLCTRIIQRKMTDFSALRNLGIKEAKSAWILMVDADEVIPEQLTEEIRHAIDHASFDGYYLRRINYMYGVRLKYERPDYTLRLFKKDKALFIHKVHEQAEVRGQTARLKNYFLHYSMKDMAEHVQKMNSYTTLASVEAKDSYPVLFIKPFYRFIQNFFFKKAYREGILGLILSLKSFFYEFVVFFKIWEKKISSKSWPEFYENINIEHEINNQADIHKDFIQSILSENPKNILEVGSGAGSISFSMLRNNNINLITVDNRLEILKTVAKNAKRIGLNIKVVCADAFNLPFKEGSFNVVFSQGLLEHFSDSDIKRIIDEQIKVTDSSVVFSVPNKYYRRKDFGNERLLSRAKWECLLKTFDVTESKNYFFTRAKRNFLLKLPLMYMGKIKK